MLFGGNLWKILQKLLELFWKKYGLVLSIMSKQIGLLIDASPTSQKRKENINVALKRLRHSHLKNVIFSHLNINSIRNKFGDLDKIVDGNTDILCIAET